MRRLDDAWERIALSRLPRFTAALFGDEVQHEVNSSGT
jgi:hypothetical protein